MGTRGWRATVSAALVAACVAGSDATSRAGDSPAPAAVSPVKERRDLVSALKKTTPGKRDALLAKLRAVADPGTAFLATLDCLFEVVEDRAKAVTERDAQGAKALAFYRQTYVNRRVDPSVELVLQYNRLVYGNHEACLQLGLLRQDVWTLQALSRELGEKAMAGDSAQRTLDDARVLQRSATSPDKRAVFLGGFEGPQAARFVPELSAAAAKGASRDERVAALAALAYARDALDVAAIASCTEEVDPFVRRLAYQALACSGSQAAMDVLVARLQKEVGIPAWELADYLTRLTGQSFGDLPGEWAKWWTENREGWTGPVAASEQHVARERDTGTRYFGLAVNSYRVLFVLDRSWSMDFAVGFDGRSLETAFSGASKIDVARKEIAQAVRGLPDGASFGIVVFGTSTLSFSPHLVDATEENRRKAIAWTERLELEGATNAWGGLRDALAMTRPSGASKDSEIADTIVFLTDGLPNCGVVASEEDILPEVFAANERHMVKIHTVYLGSEGNSDLMERLAKEFGGRTIHYTK